MTDFDFRTLNDDPELAFVELEQHFDEVLKSDLESSANSYSYTSSYIRYMNQTIAAAEALGLDFLKQWDVPSYRNSQDGSEYFNDFKSTVTGIVLKIKISRSRRHNQYSIGLTDTDKSKIRHFCDQIKVVIDGAVIGVNKKDALHRKLNKFIVEVDSIRTGIEPFADLAIGLAHVGGEVAKELEPARKWVDSIARLLGHNLDIQDAQRHLPAPLKRIEPPKLRDSEPRRASQTRKSVE